MDTNGKAALPSSFSATGLFLPLFCQPYAYKGIIQGLGSDIVFTSLALYWSHRNSPSSVSMFAI